MAHEDAPSTLTFMIPGEPVAATGPAAATRSAGLAADGLPLRGRLKGAVRVGLARDGRPAHRLQAVPGRDVVVLHLAGGPTLVLHPETARDLMRAQAAAQGDLGKPPAEDEAADVTVPTELRWSGLEAAGVATRGASRGLLGSVLLRLVEIVSGPADDLLQDWLAGTVGAQVDAQVREAVYALDAEQLPPLKDATPVAGTMPPAPGGGPTLVLVHGTFSTTEGTFAGLWNGHPQRVRALFQHYRGAVYALDHATLRRSPVENALTLVRATAPGTRLHLLTHSRGGLVAEVLARAAALQDLDDAARQLFTLQHLPAAFTKGLDAVARASVGQALHAQRQALAELVAELRQRRITVERVVRVACPARGTLLASQRLDAALSLLQWTMTLARIPVAPLLVDFLAGVAQRRTDPRLLPGLAAMVPDSPLIRWLHAAPAPVDGELRVIAGDLEGDSVASWLKTLATDAFYWTDHDLVVQTRSMYGGVPRRGDARFLLDRGGKVSHFAYFGHEHTARALTDALLQDEPAGFQRIGPLSQAGESASGVRAARRATTAARDGRQPAERPAVIVLPGIMGSHLKVDNQRIWLSWRLFASLRLLDFPDGPRRVQPDGAIGPVYEDLMDALARRHEVVEFDFDWRRPITDEARRLAGVLQETLDARAATGQPVRILAHSMGGLVARTVQIECPQVWDHWLAHPQARLLMLGTPNGGSWAPMQCLSGDDAFGNTVAAFGAPFQDHAARQLMARLPGFLQLQAGLRAGDPHGLHLQENWQALAEEDLRRLREHNAWHRDERQLEVYRWGIPPQHVLDQAIALREALDRQVAVDLPRWADRLLLVAGRARRTPDGFELGPQGLVYRDAIDAGDGRVLDDSLRLPGVRAWLLPDEHADMPGASRHFDALLDLLDHGSTTRLAPLEPAGLARPSRGTASPPSWITSRPSRQGSAAGALPPDIERDPLLRLPAPRAADPASAALRITVLNSDLGAVRTALMLGHYRSACLTGTEHAVDRLFGGALQDALDLRRYPGAPGTQQVFVDRLDDAPASASRQPRAGRPAAVVVVGLGAEGNLRPGELARSVRQGVLALAQRHRESPEGGTAGFDLSATLLGSGGAGISVGTAAQCIAQGVREADQAIAELNARQPPSAPAVGDAGPIDAPARRPWPRVGQLQLVELYLDRASEAWHALKLQAEAAPGAYALADTLAFGPGALRQPLDGGYRGSSHDYIRALGERGPGGEALVAYTIDTRRRARAEQVRHPVQQELVRSLVAEASNDRSRDEQIGRTLFQLLVPPELGPFLGDTREMLLQVDPTTAAIPWELLDTEAAGSTTLPPWAVRCKLLRTLTTVDHRRTVQDADADAHVLVIGEPRADPLRYPALPGARAEARAVCALLRRPGALQPAQIVGLVPDDDSTPGAEARTVVNALMERPWRIVHVAGHGMPPEDVDTGSAGLQPAAGSPVSGDDDRCAGPAAAQPRGVVLDGDSFLGPREVRSMRSVPELVFVNCCHLAGRSPDQLLGSQRYDRARFASGVAEALIETGVRCVVAAGWAVDDDAAAAFATTFYDALLRGARFIDASAQAREAARAFGGNTWAAYQCYGDPDWTLRRGTGDAQAPAASLEDEYVGVTSPPALALALETLAVQLAYQGRDPAAARARIRHLAARFDRAWGGIGAVAEAFGLAWEAAGDPAEALAAWRRAADAGDGSASLQVLSRLATLLARQAVQHAHAGRSADARTAIAEALQRARRLCALAPGAARRGVLAEVRRLSTEVQRKGKRKGKRMGQRKGRRAPPYAAGPGPG